MVTRKTGITASGGANIIFAIYTGVGVLVPLRAYRNSLPLLYFRRCGPFSLLNTQHRFAAHGVLSV